MVTTEKILGSLGDLGILRGFDDYTAIVQTAASSAEVIEAVGAYLSQWPRARVLRLQSMVGGWAPFDAKQNAIPLTTSDDVRKVGHDLERQRRRFEAHGAAITPELFELDMCFLLACRVIETCDSRTEICPTSKFAGLANLA